jgi:DNA repair exonuclease SbcCD nuclease subunit
MSELKSELKLAVVSDIHLGSRRNETEYIIENLDREFADNASFAQLDLLVLAGDVFDRLLNLSDDCVYSIDAWIMQLLRRCKKHDVILRVLYGTPSHDRDQSQRFVLLNEEARINANLQYVKELSIEYIEQLDINVLYVPDEWDESTDNTLSQVRELMTARNLKTVDYAFMHGQFSYQLPPVVKAPRHNEQEYLRLVDKFIFIGHIHTYSRHDRIIAQGSFDRLSHGEEEAKGHVRVTVRSRNDFEIVFHENKKARKYVTVDCEHLTLEQTLQKVHQSTDDLPDGSHVRLSCSKDNPIITEMEQLVRHRPLITWTKIVRSVDDDVNFIQDKEINDEYVPIQITRDNIDKLVMTRVSLKIQDPKLLSLAEKLLIELR